MASISRGAMGYQVTTPGRKAPFEAPRARMEKAVRGMKPGSVAVKSAKSTKLPRRGHKKGM